MPGFESKDAVLERGDVEDKVMSEKETSDEKKKEGSDLRKPKCYIVAFNLLNVII